MWAAKSLVCASRNRMLVLLLRTRTAGPSSPTRPPNIPNQNPPPLPEIPRKSPDKTPPFSTGKVLPLTFDNMSTTGPNNLSLNDCCQPCIAVRRKLFTPGPLLVSDRVKNSMMYDIALRHADFQYLVKFVRKALLQVARVESDEYTAILLNGSGTSATEGILRTILGGTKKKLIILDNGKFSKRIAEICKSSGINAKVIPVNLRTLQETLIACPLDYAGVMAVHCETSTGIVNPIDEIGDIIKKSAPEILYFVDATTSFGAINFKMSNIDFMIGNACKSLQGVPGVSFVIARRDSLERNRSKQNLGMVLDVASQHDALERSATFRHTPPTHVMLAFKECLLEYSQEGGLEGRKARYMKNTEVLKDEMRKMGFEQLYKDSENPNGYIVTTFKYPDVPQFVFDEFSKRLSDAGHVICCDKQATAPQCFRIGSMGDINEDDIRALTTSIRNVCGDMRIELPLSIPIY